MKNKILLSGIALVALLVSMSAASAFGVSTPYWDGYPLKMAPGEVKVISFNLQNAGGDKTDAYVKVVINQGSEIASLSQDTYIVKTGTTDTKVPLTIALPEDAIGTYRINLDFKTMTSGESDGVAMGIGMNAGFDVVVVENVPEPVPEQPVQVPMYFSVLLLGLILVIIAAAVLKKQKKRRAR